MIKTISSVKVCTGCSACMHICPVNAISMQPNDEGFLYPVIDKNLCTECGLCKKICPSQNPDFKNTENPDCFAAAASDELRKESTSGAVFPILANYILNNHGYVCGAAWAKDKSIEHIIIDNEKELYKLKGSKYFQSNVKNCYPEIEKLLKNDKLVLFSGTPCQVAGLKAYLKKDYDNLFSIDIICHGVPSPMVYKQYIKELPVDENNSELITNFRDKINGWTPRLSTTTITSTTKVTYQADCDMFLKSFLQNLSLRESCFECPFQKIPRQGDLTIGDYWGIDAFDTKLNDQKGTSVVLINNEKGKMLIEKTKSEFKFFVQTPLKFALDGNPCLYKSVEKPTQNRKLFFRLLKEKSMKKAVEICADDKCDYLLVNFWWSGCNYGAVLTAYALQQYINQLGFTNKLLDTNEAAIYFQNYESSCFNKFAKKFLNTTKKYNYQNLTNLCKNITGIILGSDQVLRPDYMGKQFNKYLLNFANNNNKKISISASFGQDIKQFKKLLNKNTHKKMKMALQSFDYLSCREISGKEIFKEMFQLDADFILDPVFLADKSVYDKILEKSTVDEKAIVSYVLDSGEEYNKLYNYLEKEVNNKVIRIDTEKSDINVEDWLKYIKDCKFLITDSFHGVCFALIFNKPFICIKNKERGEARFNSLIETFDIGDSFVSSIEEIYSIPLNKSFNYDKINIKIEQEIVRSRKIIENVLINNYSNNPSAQKNKILNEKFLKYQKNIKFKDNIKYIKYKILAKICKGKKKEHYIFKKQTIKQSMQWN